MHSRLKFYMFKFSILVSDYVLSNFKAKLDFEYFIKGLLSGLEKDHPKILSDFI